MRASVLACTVAVSSVWSQSCYNQTKLSGAARIVTAGSSTSRGEKWCCKSVYLLYPCKLEHWGTPPPRMGDGMDGQEPACGPPPLLPVVPDRNQHFQNTGPVNAGVSQHGLVQSMAQLMHVQMSMLTANAQVGAMQSLPALAIPPITGEDIKGDDDNFEKWLELLEEWGRLVQWSKEQHLCQLRAHLTKTPQQIFVCSLRRSASHMIWMFKH